MLLNASLDTTNPPETSVKGEMTRAVLLASYGSETLLNTRREGKRILVYIPEIGIWDIAHILLL